MSRKSMVAAIVSPQEAVALVYVQKFYKIERVYLQSFVGYTNDRYTDIALNILKENVDAKVIKIKVRQLAFKSTDLKSLLMSYFSVISAYVSLRKIKTEIKKCIDEEGVVLGGCFHSPLLLMGDWQDKILFIEHSPADQRERSSVTTQKSKKNLLKNKTRKETTKKLTKSLLEYIFSFLVQAFFPLYFSGRANNKGFSWCEEGGDIKKLDYAYISKKVFSNKMVAQDFQNDTVSNSAILLVDHPAAFKEIPCMQEDLISLDLSRYYAEMLKSRVSVDDKIIIKIHPFAASRLSKSKMEAFKKKLRSRIRAVGFKYIFFFDEIVSPDYSNYPVEIFFEGLNTSTVIGIYSSPMVMSGNWPNIRFISDCSAMPSFRKMRENDKLVFDFSFERY